MENILRRCYSIQFLTTSKKKDASVWQVGKYEMPEFEIGTGILRIPGIRGMTEK